MTLLMGSAKIKFHSLLLVIIMFTANINSAERIIRLLAGIALLSIVFIGPKTPWGYVGVILIVTAFINYCPAYGLFGFSTKKK